MSSDDEEREAFRITRDDLDDEGMPRRRFRSKEDQTYGIFGEGSDEEDEERRPQRGRGFDAPISFVSGVKKGKQRRPSQGVEDDGDDEDEEGGAEDSSADENDDEEEGPAAAADEEDAAVAPQEYEDEWDEDASENKEDEEEAQEGSEDEPASTTTRQKRKRNPPPPPSQQQSSMRSQLLGTLFSAPIITTKPIAASTIADPFSTTKSTTKSTTTASTETAKYSTFGHGSHAKVDKDFGAWEKHTKGFGMKMLKKMGFKPGEGLGVANQGIAAPIDAGPVRQGRRALQDHGERSKQSKTIMPVKEDADKEEDVFQAHLAQWRVGKDGRQRRPRYTFKTAEQVAKEARVTEPDPSRVKIVDMSGPQTRVLTGYDQIRTAAQRQDVPMPELQHNVRLLVDLAASDIQRCSSQLQRHTKQQAALTAERMEMEETIAKEAGFIATLDRILTIMEECNRRLESADNPLTLQECVAIFADLKRAHPKEYSLYCLSALALGMVTPLIRAAIAAWAPLQDPSMPVPHFVAWRELLDAAEDRDKAPMEETEFGDYERLCWDTIMPCVRTALTCTWNPRDVAGVMDFLATWQSLLAPWIMDNIFTQLVLPRLRTEVERWSPMTDPVPVHVWIHAWLPFLGTQLNVLYAPIRYKLAMCLQAWHPSDGSAHAMLAPWKDVFAPADMAALVTRCIVPKLVEAMRMFAIDPRQQNLDAFHWVMAWRDLVPIADMTALLDTSFFPKLLAVLCEWLSSPTADLEEVSRWYLGWKDMFDAELLAQPAIRMHLSRALDLMSRAATGSALPPPSSLLASFMPVYAPAAPAAPRRVAPVDIAATGPTSIRDLLQQRANERGIMFMPKPGWTTPDGKPLYVVGTATVYFDGGVVYVRAAGAETFRPMAVEAVLALAV